MRKHQYILETLTIYWGKRQVRDQPRADKENLFINIFSINRTKIIPRSPKNNQRPSKTIIPQTKPRNKPKGTRPTEKQSTTHFGHILDEKN